jgi:DNA helicase-2/ATP-dependent DNA helicase PcrA
MEEGLFPHQRSVDEPGRLEEERRLCYVGITRARRRVVLTCAERRRLYGSETWCLPSRFIGEIPDELIEEVRPRVRVTPTPAYAASRGTATVGPDAEPAGLKLGTHVRHTKFGEGVVTNYEGQGSSARVEVNFSAAGSKWLVVSYAKLERVGA